MNTTVKHSATMLILLCATGLAFAADDLSQSKDPIGGSQFNHQEFHKGVYDPQSVYLPNDAEPNFPHPSAQAMERWHDLKYGVFISWGPYCVRACKSGPWDLCGKPLEWMGQYYDIPRTWNPQDFDANAWMAMLKRDGAKYFTFTARHHDGFSMYDTKTHVKKRRIFTGPDAGKFEDCDIAYSIMETPFGRDITREVVDAGRRQGLAVALYFSHIDWYDADFRFDYYNPLRDTNYTPQSDPQGFARFKARYMEQVRELLTNYGPLTDVFFDIGFPQQYWPYVKEMVTMARQLQPDCLFSHRGIGAYGDYCTPEQEIPPSATASDAYCPWAVFHSLDPYGGLYSPDPAGYRSGDWLVRSLVDIVAKGGNFMLGAGPDGNGKFHPKVVEALDYAGNWLAVNGESIYATRPWNVWHEGENIRFTRTKDHKTLYAISLEWPGDTLTLKSVPADNVAGITLLGYNKPLDWRNDPEVGLIITLPAELQDENKRPCKDAYAFKIAMRK